MEKKIDNVFVCVESVPGNAEQYGSVKISYSKCAVGDESLKGSGQFTMELNDQDAQVLAAWWKNINEAIKKREEIA